MAKFTNDIIEFFKKNNISYTLEENPSEEEIKRIRQIIDNQNI